MLCPGFSVGLLPATKIFRMAVSRLLFAAIVTRLYLTRAQTCRFNAWLTSGRDGIVMDRQTNVDISDTGFENAFALAKKKRPRLFQSGDVKSSNPSPEVCSP
jgi:hypothetical protein